MDNFDKKYILNLLKYAASLGVAAFLIWYSFRGLDVASLFARFKEIDYKWIALSIILALISHWLRAYRWNLMLEPLGYKLMVYRTFLAVMDGYFANLLVPRMGEVTRCGVMKKTDDVPMANSIGTVFTERVFDLVILLFLIGITFTLEFDKLYNVLNQVFSDRTKGFYENSGLLIGGGVATVLLFVVGVVLIRIFKDNIVSHSLYAKVLGLFRGLVSGMVSVKNLDKPIAFFASTVGIWVLYYLMAYVVFFAMPVTSGLSMMAGLSVLIMGGIGMAAPVQGGIGAYHILVGSVLALYGLDKESGMLFAFVLHTSQFISIFIIGGISYIISVFLPKRISYVGN